MNVKIVSWNIAGGRKSKTLDQFDYQKQDYNYFTAQIKSLNPDIVCLQEVEQRDSLENFGFKNIFFTPTHPSHINRNRKMGNAIYSNFPVTKKSQSVLPFPKFKMYWKNGQAVEQFNKNLIWAKIKKISIANTQLQPIGLWGFNYFESGGAGYAKEVEKTFLNLSRPVILCGDFSGEFPNDQVQQVFTKFFSKLELKDAIVGKITRPSRENIGKQTDHIFYSPEMKLINSKVIKTPTDHYLCFAEFESNH